jgi:hypothetical protein
VIFFTSDSYVVGGKEKESNSIATESIMWRKGPCTRYKQETSDENMDCMSDRALKK